MNNVSLQLQKYRALKGLNNSVSQIDENVVLERHPEKMDYFRQLMARWEASHLQDHMEMDFAISSKNR